MSASKDVTAMRSFLEKRSVFNRGRGIDISTLHKPFSIEFRNVSFTYADLKKPTLDNISFKIEPGEKIALVGENGTGKTTIIKLLSGFYKPTSGQILIDGHPLEEFNIHDYYSLLSVINQDINVIGVTIKENIASTVIHSDIDEDRVRKAIKDAGLEEKISSLPNKEDTYLTQNISDDGIMLSGGETQKLMLARSLYKGGDFLMLDEPTSALDPIAEGEIYKKYSDITQNKTSIFISHRLSSTRFCSNILYLKDGKIIEQGSHQELMGKKGEYYKVYTIQAHYYQEEQDNEKTL